MKGPCSSAKGTNTNTTSTTTRSNNSAVTKQLSFKLQPQLKAVRKMTIESRLALIQKNLEEILDTQQQQQQQQQQQHNQSSKCEKKVPYNGVKLPLLESAQVEIRTLELWRCVVAECLGSLCYVFFICGVSIPWTGHFPPFLSVAFASALAYGALTHSIFPGSHLNPTFTLALTVALKLISPLRCILFITAQCGGAIAGSAILYGLTVAGYQGSLGGTTIASHISPFQACGLELVLSFVLTLAYLSSYTRGQSVIPTTATLLAASLVALPCTGAGLNPVRSLGPSFVMNKWPNHWVFWVGPIMGGMFAAYFHRFILTRRKKKDNGPNIRSRRENGAGDGSESLSDIIIPISGNHEIPNSVPGERHLFGEHPSRGGPVHQHFEPIYGGTRSLYMKPSPILPRSNLCRSQSVYASKRLEQQQKDKELVCSDGSGGGKSSKYAQDPVQKKHQEKQTTTTSSRNRERDLERQEYYSDKYSNYDEDHLYLDEQLKKGPSTAPPSLLVSGPPSYESENIYYKGHWPSGGGGGGCVDSKGHKSIVEKRQERRENHANRLLAQLTSINSSNCQQTEGKCKDLAVQLQGKPQTSTTMPRYFKNGENHNHSPQHGIHNNHNQNSSRFQSQHHQHQHHQNNNHNNGDDLQMNDLSKKLALIQGDSSGNYSIARKPYEYLTIGDGGGDGKNNCPSPSGNPGPYFQNGGGCSGSDKESSSNYSNYSRILEPIFNSKSAHPTSNGNGGGILSLSPNNANINLRNDQITYSFH